MAAKSPWFWKLAGVVLIATGGFLAALPLLLPAATIAVYVIFLVSGLVFAAIGVGFMLTVPAPRTFACTRCKLETPKARNTFFCPGCGKAMEESEDELKPAEILCPHCDEIIEKKPGACPACSRPLPGFGTETVKGATVCRWCTHPVKPGDKFCRFCSAPLATPAKPMLA